MLKEEMADCDGMDGNLVGRARWYRTSAQYDSMYKFMSIVSLGVIPVITVFWPIYVGVSLRYKECDPKEAEFAVFEKDGEQVICRNLEHYFIPFEATQSLRNSKRGEGLSVSSSQDLFASPRDSEDSESDQFDEGEHVITMRFNFKIICASNMVDNYMLYQLKADPSKFSRFLRPSLGSYCTNNIEFDVERTLLPLLYGSNSTGLEQLDTHAESIRVAFEPIVILGYIFIAVWMYQGYWANSLMIAITIYGYIFYSVEHKLFERKQCLKMDQSQLSKDSDVQLVNVDENNFQKSPDKKKRGHRRVDTGESEDSSFSQLNIMTNAFSVANLTVGDRFLVTDGMVVPCDAILISGKVVVDEAMISGESAPVSKQHLSFQDSADYALEQVRPLVSLRQLKLSNKSTPDERSKREINLGSELMTKRHASALIGGTTVNFASPVAVAVVCRTGVSSTIGSSVLSLLKGNPGLNELYQDLTEIVWWAVLIGSFLFFCSIGTLSYMELSFNSMLILYTNVISLAVPIGLAVFLLSTGGIEIVKLRSLGIYIREISAAVLPGIVNRVAFDKTGTLTDDTLKFVHATCVPGTQSNELKNFNETSLPDLIKEVMSSCHSLQAIPVGRINMGLPRQNSNKIVGDLLEIELVRASGWNLISPSAQTNHLMCVEPSNTQSGPRKNRVSSLRIILRTFAHSPDTSYSASLIRRPNGEIMYFLKGAPEIIARKCSPSSIPSDLSERLIKSARKGQRVLAIAYLSCGNGFEYINISQDEIEERGNIAFGGLLCLSEKPKKESRATIRDLHAANVVTSMITGDFPFTAIACASELKMIHYQHDTLQHAIYLMYVVDQASNGDIIIINASTGVVDTDMDLLSLIFQASLQSMMFGDGEGVPQISSLDLEAGSGSREHDQQETICENIKVPPRGVRIEITLTGSGMRGVQSKYPVEVLTALIRTTKIFARCKPVDKGFIVKTMSNTPTSLEFAVDNNAQEDGVLFCGNGLNDIIALRESTVGVCLSTAEFSSVSPIISHVMNPSAVIDVLKSGRYALSSSYALIDLSLLINFSAVFQLCFMYTYGLKPDVSQYWSGQIISTIGIILVMTLPSTGKLDKEGELPKQYLIFKNILHLCVQMLIAALFSVLAVKGLAIDPNYTKYIASTTGNSADLESLTFETTTAQLMNNMQIIIFTIISVEYNPFRAKWFNAKIFVGTITFLISVVVFMVIFSGLDFDPSLNTFLGISALHKYTLAISAFCILHLFASLGCAHLINKWSSPNERRKVKHMALFTPGLKKMFAEGNFDVDKVKGYVNGGDFVLSASEQTPLIV